MRNRLLQILNSLRDKAYRAMFVETQIEALIPCQIRAMRQKKGWTQKQLAEPANQTSEPIESLYLPLDDELAERHSLD